MQPSKGGSAPGSVRKPQGYNHISLMKHKQAGTVLNLQQEFPQTWLGCRVLLLSKHTLRVEAETPSIVNTVHFWGLPLRNNPFFLGAVALRVMRVPSSGGERTLHAAWKPVPNTSLNWSPVVPWFLRFSHFSILVVFKENCPPT